MTAESLLDLAVKLEGAQGSAQGGEILDSPCAGNSRLDDLIERGMCKVVTLSDMGAVTFLGDDLVDGEEQVGIRAE